MLWRRGPQQACALLFHRREAIVLVFALISPRGRLIFCLGYIFIVKVGGPVEGVQLREGSPSTGLSLEGTVKETSSLLCRALLHEQWEAGGYPRLEEVRSHIKRQQARHSLSSQTRLMQRVGEGSCGVHAKETHPTADCILHAWG